MDVSGDVQKLPSLSRKFPADEVTVALTESGLLLEHAEELASIYTEHKDWTIVEEKWIQGKKDSRSTKKSSKKVFRNISSRFKSVDSSLPTITQLDSILKQCQTEQEKAQILYLYLIEDDPLVQHVVHEYGNNILNSDTSFKFNDEIVLSALDAFEYDDGSKLDYAEGTLRRWARGFRSVMREIGVLPTSQAVQGETPTLGPTALRVTAAYSWKKDGKDWIQSPKGWLYLFQDPQKWNNLVERLAETDSWDVSDFKGEIRARPTEDGYSWANEGEER